MNKEKRRQLKSAKKMLEEANTVVENVLDKEEDSLANYEEVFEGSSKCDIMENAISEMEDCIDCIEAAISHIDCAVSS